MTFGRDDYRDDEQARRLRNRSILLFIILATVPCYIVGGVMLGVAPDETVNTEERTVPPPAESTDVFTTATSTLTLEATVTSVLDATRSPTTTLAATPQQFIPPTATPFPTRVIPTSTLAPTFTLAPSITPSPTHTQTAIPTATQTIAATDAVNQPPVFDAVLPDVSLAAGSSQQITVSASDPDGDVVSLTAVSSNALIVTIPAQGTLSFTIEGVAAGSANITVTLTDSSGAMVADTFVVTVQAVVSNSNPSFTQQPAPVVVDVGVSATLRLAFSDPDGDAVTSEVTITDTGVATATKLSETDYTITGITANSTTATIQLRDGRGGTAQAVINITVNGGGGQENVAPTISAIEPSSLSLAIGDSRTVIVTATDANNDTLTLSATSLQPAIATATKIDNQSFTVNAVATGTTTVVITVSDGLLNAETTLNVTVTTPNAAPSFIQLPPQSLTVGVGETTEVDLQYSDADGDAVMFTVTTTPTDIVVREILSEVSFSITGINAGTTQLTIRLTDGRGGVTTHTINVTVTP